MRSSPVAKTDSAFGGYIFISYARKDTAYVTRLTAHLEANGVRVWYDQEIPSGDRWRQSLRTRVVQAAAVLLVESPNAQESEWVGREIIQAEWARRPLLILLLDGELRKGIADLQAESVTSSIMPTERFVARARELISQATSYAAPAPLFRGGAVISPEAWQFRRPEGMIERPAQVDEIALALRLGSSGTVGVTGIYGGGGLGKTIVAQMVVARKDIQKRFPGGLLWVDLGQEARDVTLADLIGSLCVRLGGRHPELFSPVEAGKQFAGLLAARPATLIVLDDVWFPEQLEPFEADAGPARFLVTTRVTSLLPPAAVSVSVDQLDNAQSRTVLLAGLPQLPEAAIARLVAATGGWALVVNSTNAILRRVIRDGQEEAQRLGQVHDPARYAGWLADVLTAEGVSALNLGNQYARDKTFAATMRPSLALLSRDDRHRAYELSIFAEDTDIDIGLLSLLWNATGGLTASQTRSLAAELRDLNLVTNFQPEVGTLRIHDLVREHLSGELGTEEFRAVHRTLLEAAASHFAIEADKDGLRAWWDLPASTGYLWRHLGGHLSGGNLSSELDSLLSDLRWTEAKLLGVGAASLDADLARSADTTAVALRQALPREANLLSDVSPSHSHADILAARLGTNVALADAAERFRRTLPTGVVRMRPGWPLPDAPDTSLRYVLAGHRSTHDHDGLLGSAAVTAVAISPDGSWLATASYDGTVRLWDAATGRERATLTGHTEAVKGIAIAPDGTWLASLSEDRTARLWDAKTGKVRRIDDRMPLDPTDIAVSPDGSWIAAAGRWGLLLWDAITGADRAFIHHTGDPLRDHRITGVAIAPDGSWLATASWDRTARLWDTPPPPSRPRWWSVRRQIATVEPAARLNLRGHTDGVTAVAISPDGTWLVTGGLGYGGDSTVRLWDAVTGAERAVLTSHTYTVTGIAISPDGSWFATSSGDYTARVWDAATGSERANLRHPRGVNGVAIAPDGAWLATVCDDGNTRVWDTPTQPRRAVNAHAEGVAAMAISPDGTWLATASESVRVWDASTGEPVASLTGHTHNPRAIAIAPDGRRAFSIGRDDPILVWDDPFRPEAQHRRARRIHGRTRELTALAVAPDGTWLATCDHDGEIRLWDLATWRERAVLEESPTKYPNLDRIGSIAIAPDGTWLAACRGEQFARLWDTSTCRERATLSGHEAEVTSVAIAPDGTWLATTSADHTVRLWDATTATELARLSGTTGWRNRVAISPSGNRLATASQDGTIRLWDKASGVNVATMRVAGSLLTICWAPDGAAVFAGGLYGAYRFDISGD